jgi:crotonobetainyl-CoA:carnitine CoA-transferase CaiB-like acyl-CoA transferase
MPNLPLEGILVIDMATLLAGPVCTTFLGDFGATVIKVERPGLGDAMRAAGVVPDGRHTAWLNEGRNKKSITLDLHTAEGQALAHKLAAKADVVVMNFRPGKAESWGIGPEDLHRTNPDLILLLVSAYGQTGPYRRRGGFDRTASAFAGLTYVTGFPDGPPVRSGYAVIDYMTAYLGAFGVMTALYNRAVNKAGGEVIDLSLVEAALRSSESALTDYGMTGQVRGRTGNRNPGFVPADDFETKDGRTLVINAAVENLWRRLAKAMNMPELLEDPRFAGRLARNQNQEALYRIIAAWVHERTAEEARRILDEAEVPADFIQNIAEVAQDAHMRFREAVLEVDDPDKGKVLVPGVFPKLFKHPGRVRHLGLRLGEHNQEIYGGLLGLAPEEMAALEEKGAI